MLLIKIKLNMEKKKLNRMIVNNNSNLINDLILHQSKKVDKLILSYIKLTTTKEWSILSKIRLLNNVI